MFADEGDAGDVQAIAAAEHVEHTVAADDAGPGEGRCDGQVHLVAANEDSGDDEGNVFGNGKTQAAEEEHAEENAIADAAAIHQIEHAVDGDGEDGDEGGQLRVQGSGFRVQEMPLDVVHRLLPCAGAVDVFHELFESHVVEDFIGGVGELLVDEADGDLAGGSFHGGW